MSRSRGSDSTITTDRTVPGLISRYGIVPNVIQILAPEEYARNEAYEESLEGGGGVVPYPPDPNYPEDSRSDSTAWTPMYRGGQNYIFDLWLDPWSYHGPGTESLNYTGSNRQWYDWDGSTIYSIWCPSTYTEAQKQAHRIAWFDSIFPDRSNGNYCIRGLKQLYDLHQPFADPYHPTVREYEVWNDKVLNHFRVLAGLNPAIPLQELYIMCKWSDERKTTPLWDSLYPEGDHGGAYGPCYDPWSTNIHCGTTFKPSDLSHQSPYWNDWYVNTKLPRHGLITLNQASEAIVVWYNGTAMTQMSRYLLKLFEAARTGGQITGHGGTHLFRQYYGLRNGRSKWAGALQSPPSGYTY